RYARHAARSRSCTSSIAARPIRPAPRTTNFPARPWSGSGKAASTTCAFPARTSAGKKCNRPWTACAFSTSRPDALRAGPQSTGDTMKLKDKAAIVTGAASGIGQEIARVYAREGARVAIADLNPDAAEAAAKEIRGNGGQAMSVAMDVTDEKAVNDGVAAVVKAFGGVDILVSNAGIQIVHPLEEFTYAEWKKLMAIHVDGAFLTTRACLPVMYKSGRGGSIIYMGSVHSKE